MSGRRQSREATNEARLFRGSTREQLAELLPSFGMPAEVEAFLRPGEVETPVAAQAGGGTMV